jgi:hypothetical protein
MITVPLACADGPEGDDLGVVVLGDRGHGEAILVSLQTDGEWASVTPGRPPRVSFVVPLAVHEAALAGGELTRD